MEWVMPQEIGIAIPHGWETEWSPAPLAPGCCPATTTTCTEESTPDQTATPSSASAPRGGTLTTTDSTATFLHETGNDSSTTTGAFDPSTSSSNSSTYKLKNTRSRRAEARPSPITSQAPCRSLRTRTISYRTC
uniref:Assembly activating protein n=1 Tax=Adeno-associated virus TaxID=272636 RepID=A0A6B9PVZ0_9VIRU|nr:assembly activating protein [Adeno-associated virus]